MAVVSIRQEKPACPRRPETTEELRRVIDDDLEEALRNRDVDQLLTCIMQLSKEAGMPETARRMGIQRPLIYRMLRRGSNPKISNIFKLFEIFNIRITVERRAEDLSSNIARPSSLLREVSNR